MSATLADQLRPVADRLFPKRPRIIPVTQVTADVAGDDKEAALDEARNQVLRWMRNRAGQLPAQAWKHDDFEINEPGMQVAAVRIRTNDADYWTARFDHLDQRFARNWTTEIALARLGDLAVFGARLVISTMEDEPEFEPSVPGVILQLSEKPGLLRHGEPISALPWVIADDDDIESLISLIEDPRRREPIFVVSLDDGQSDPATATIDPFRLARSCIGIARIVVLPGDQSFLLSDRVGKDFSVFRGAVRTYRPGCNFVEDNPYAHPLILPERIKSWQNGGAAEFLVHLVRHAAWESIARLNPDRELPSFAKVKQQSLARRRESAAQHGDQRAELDLLWQENESLRSETEAAFSLASGEELARRAAEELWRDTEAENGVLRWRIKQLEQKIKILSGAAVDADVPIPEDLGALKSWAQEHLAGRIVVTGKAARAAKDSPFRDVQFAYRAVLALANEYYDMKMQGGDETQQQFEAALRELKLENSRSGDETRLRECGEEFFVEFQGKKHLLEWHLKNTGNTRDPSRCFRLYYFWDDETQQVVIGSMPGHLTTRAT